MTPPPNLPNNPELTFNQNKENLSLNESISRLSMAIDNLRLMTSQMGSNAALDPVLQSLKDQYGGNTTKIRMEYESAQKAWSTQTLGPILQSLQQSQQQMVMIQQQSLANQQQSMMYGNRQALPAASMETVPFYAQAIGALRNQYQPMYQQLGYQSAYQDTYYRNMPYENNLKQYGYFNSERPMQSPFLQRLAEEQYQRELVTKITGPRPRTADIKEYYEYQNEMNSRTQQASLNFMTSSTLGVRGGMISKPEMNQGYLPAVNNLADTLGTTFDQALDILKKMQDLGATAADMRSGRTHDIVSGVNDTIKTLGALSKLLNSEDLTQLMSAAENLSRFGAGNFRVGLANIAESLRITPLQASRVLDKYGSAMDPNQNPYLSALGTNQAGFGMGLFGQRTQQDFQRYGAAGDTSFQRLGGAAGLAGIVGGTLTENMMSPGFLLAARGKGNFFAGADALTSEMMSDPTKFYLNLQNQTYEQQQKYTGDRGMELLKQQIEQFKKDYPTMSTDEATLAMIGGDANKYAALQQYEKTSAGALEDTRKKYQFSGMFGPSIYAPKRYEQYQDTFSRQWAQSNAGMSEDMANSTWFTRSAREAFFNVPLLGASGRGMTRPAGGFAPDQWTGEWGTANTWLPNRNWELMAPENQSVQVSADTYNPFQTGFFDPSGRRMVAKGGGGEAAYSGRLSRNDVADGRIGTTIANALGGTDTAIERIQDVLNMILNGDQMPVYAHIAEVMHSAVNAFQSEAGLDPKAAREAHDFINNASIEDVVRNVDTMLDPASPAHALIQAVYTGQRDIGRVMRTDEMMGKSMFANILRSSGMSEQTIRGMGVLDPKSGLRKTAEFLNRNQVALNTTNFAVGLSAAIAFPELAAPVFIAGIIADVAIQAGAPVLTSVDDMMRAVETMTGKGVNVKSVMEFASDENSTSFQKEIIYCGVILSAKWSMSLANFMTSDRVSTITKMLVSIMTQYKASHSRLFAQKKSSEKAPNPDAFTLSAADLASVVDSLIKTFGVDSFDGPDKEASAKKVYSSILALINSPQSELGGVIRTTALNDIQATVARDIQSSVQQGFDSGQLGYTSGTLGQFAGSIENLVEEGNVTALRDIGLGLSGYQKGQIAEKDFEKLKSEVAKTVGSKGSKDADKVPLMLDKLRTYVRSPGGELSLTAGEMSALKEYDPDMASRLSDVLKSDQSPAKKQESVNRLLGELTRRQEDITQSTQQQSQYWANIIYAIADQVMNDKSSPGATALKKLLAGES